MADRKRDPARRSMPLTEWPQRDRDLWEAAIREGDVLDESGPAAHWRPKTRARVVQNYGRWLTFLVRRHELEVDVSPARRVRQECVRAYIAEQRRQEVASTTLEARIRDLREALRVMGPEPVPEWLKQTARRLATQATPARAKAGRVQSAGTLFALGLSLMERAIASPTARRKHQPARFRDGLAIAFLACRSIRMSNLTGIRIGTNLIRIDGDFWLRFSADEMKGKRPYEVPLPAELTRFIELYLSRYRPVLLDGGTSDRLWISTEGQPITSRTLYEKIRRLTERALGVAINPHLFRDSLVTTVAHDDPEHVRITAPLLAHASLRTTTRHYNQAKMAQAVRQHQANILALRRSLRETR